MVTGNLILSRHVGETLVIGDNVLVRVLGLDHNGVRLSVVAPRDVPVHRQEVLDEIKQDGRTFTQAHAARLRRPR